MKERERERVLRNNPLVDGIKLVKEKIYREDRTKVEATRREVKTNEGYQAEGGGRRKGKGLCVQIQAVEERKLHSLLEKSLEDGTKSVSHQGLKND